MRETWKCIFGKRKLGRRRRFECRPNGNDAIFPFFKIEHRCFHLKTKNILIYINRRRINNRYDFNNTYIFLYIYI